MIQNANVGVPALIGIDDQTWTPFIVSTYSSDYGVVYSTFSRQTTARALNQQKLDRFTEAFNSAQNNENAGRPHDPPPTEPTFTFITDGHHDYFNNIFTDGVESQIPWPWPLPKFKPLNPVGSK
jgi:hypothetical protein